MSETREQNIVAGVVCGPTVGCGKLIPYRRERGVFGEVFVTPEHCPHCGKWCGVQHMGAAGPVMLAYEVQATTPPHPTAPARGEDELCKCGHPATHHAGVSRYCLWLGCSCKGVEPTGTGQGVEALERWEGTDDAMYEVPGRRLREMSAEIVALGNQLRAAREEAARLERERDEYRSAMEEFQGVSILEAGERVLAEREADRLRSALAARDAELAGVREECRRLEEIIRAALRDLGQPGADNLPIVATTVWRELQEARQQLAARKAQEEGA